MHTFTDWVGINYTGYRNIIIINVILSMIDYLHVHFVSFDYFQEGGVRKFHSLMSMSTIYNLICIVYHI